MWYRLVPFCWIFAFALRPLSQDRSPRARTSRRPRTSELESTKGGKNVLLRSRSNRALADGSIHSDGISPDVGRHGTRKDMSRSVPSTPIGPLPRGTSSCRRPWLGISATPKASPTPHAPQSDRRCPWAPSSIVFNAGGTIMENARYGKCFLPRTAYDAVQ